MDVEPVDLADALASTDDVALGEADDRLVDDGDREHRVLVADVRAELVGVVPLVDRLREQRLVDGVAVGSDQRLARDRPDRVDVVERCGSEFHTGTSTCGYKKHTDGTGRSGERRRTGIENKTDERSANRREALYEMEYVAAAISSMVSASASAIT
ncbi:hypothetical protein FK85_23560 [Halorubrum saccharovorum]|uniref:Uncharacterized protein n=1 Tax=Halorubrum saccharovorum TaxID=2248 RepID=A0A0F8AVW0_9EURY|nr:hypothetical protein FK85_23560 [Halorubrum saccharovorum]